jgi:hypothetical protein
MEHFPINLAMKSSCFPYRRKGRVYLHGQLEDAMGFDIFESSSIDLESVSDGIHHAFLSIDGNNPITSLLFVWKNTGRTSEPVGLVVDINDLKSISYALSKLKEKSQFL